MKWMLIPKAFQSEGKEALLKKIDQGLLVQLGLNTFRDDAVARHYAEGAKEEGYLCIRRDAHTEYYKAKAF